jgi:hypothetical protein
MFDLVFWFLQSSIPYSTLRVKGKVLQNKDGKKDFKDLKFNYLLDNDLKYKNAYF